ncbi:hypothetical protein CBR_g23819 [Chara braunii]|uniref:CCHC-type domain-containing protein n=1 Tax=Chara braunii TaxID=69332 RepID=A0A388JVS7_CHABU|nr:hypothetical protein CBR_g23819 [Chara braunii]|eukprot:GBG61867.1 hypothetical protein CBR_g23819 [Chara braunii]
MSGSGPVDDRADIRRLTRAGALRVPHVFQALNPGEERRLRRAHALAAGIAAANAAAREQATTARAAAMANGANSAASSSASSSGTNGGRLGMPTSSTSSSGTSRSTGSRKSSSQMAGSQFSPLTPRQRELREIQQVEMLRRELEQDLKEATDRENAMKTRAARLESLEADKAELEGLDESALTDPLKVLKKNMLSLHAHVDSKLNFMQSTLDQILNALTKPGFRPPAQSPLPLSTMSGPFPVQAAKWLDGVVIKAGYGRRMADWAKSLTLDQFMEMVEARWHNPQEAQKATDAINKLDQRKFGSVRELTTTVESLILVPGINYSDQFLLTTFVRCLPENIRNLLASEARTEYHSFETLSRKALDLEATLGNAQPTSGNDSKKKSPQEWKKKGAKLMMVESDGTQTEIDELSDLMDYSEYDGEEVVEGSTLAVVVKTKAVGRGKGQPRGQGKTASNQTKQVEWVKAGLDQDVWRDRRTRGACINCGEYGHSQYKCQNAKHAMNRIFHDHLDNFVMVYLDDILIFSKSAKEHAQHVETVLSLLRQHKYRVNLEKCEFGRTKILYLGHEVSAEGIRPEDAKVASIRDWPRPQTVTEVRSFLGMCGYYRNFVKNYSTVASPLTDLTRLDTPRDWSDECEGAFKKLKHALMNHEVLMVPDPQKPFIVTTDASQYDIGAVLAQQDGKKLRPIEYMSKKMPSKKLAKFTYERELYALYKALVHWRHFLLVRFFYLRTDHQTLKWIKTQPALSDALERWIEVIDQYDFKLEYLKGEYNKVAYALSCRADYLGALVSDFGVSNEVTQSLVGAYQEDPATMDIIRKLQTKDKATESTARSPSYGARSLSGRIGPESGSKGTERGDSHGHTHRSRTPSPQGVGGSASLAIQQEPGAPDWVAGEPHNGREVPPNSEPDMEHSFPRFQAESSTLGSALEKARERMRHELRRDLRAKEILSGLDISEDGLAEGPFGPADGTMLWSNSAGADLSSPLANDEVAWPRVPLLPLNKLRNLEGGHYLGGDGSEQDQTLIKALDSLRQIVLPHAHSGMDVVEPAKVVTNQAEGDTRPRAGVKRGSVRVADLYMDQVQPDGGITGNEKSEGRKAIAASGNSLQESQWRGLCTERVSVDMSDRVFESLLQTYRRSSILKTAREYSTALNAIASLRSGDRVAMDGRQQGSEAARDVCRVSVRLDKEVGQEPRKERSFSRDVSNTMGGNAGIAKVPQSAWAAKPEKPGNYDTPSMTAAAPADTAAVAGKPSADKNKKVDASSSTLDKERQFWKAYGKLFPRKRGSTFGKGLKGGKREEGVQVGAGERENSESRKANPSTQEYYFLQVSASLQGCQKGKRKNKRKPQSLRGSFDVLLTNLETGVTVEGGSRVKVNRDRLLMFDKDEDIGSILNTCELFGCQDDPASLYGQPIRVQVFSTFPTGTPGGMRLVDEVVLFCTGSSHVSEPPGLPADAHLSERKSLSSSLQARPLVRKVYSDSPNIVKDCWTEMYRKMMVNVEQNRRPSVPGRREEAVRRSSDSRQGGRKGGKGDGGAGERADGGGEVVSRHQANVEQSGGYAIEPKIAEPGGGDPDSLPSAGASRIADDRLRFPKKQQRRNSSSDMLIPSTKGILSPPLSSRSAETSAAVGNHGAGTVRKHTSGTRRHSDSLVHSNNRTIDKDMHSSGGDNWHDAADSEIGKQSKGGLQLTYTDNYQSLIVAALRSATDAARWKALQLGEEEDVNATLEASSGSRRKLLDVLRNNMKDKLAEIKKIFLLGRAQATGQQERRKVRTARG